MEYKFGFADIEHEKLPEILEMMQTYKISKYIIARETVKGKTHVATNGEHMHFVLHVEPKAFKNWLETLKNRYNLTGKNGNTGRYCGFVKNVKDPDKLLAYTCKDENLSWCGFEDNEIKEYIEKSFKKKDSQFDILMNHLIAVRPEKEGMLTTDINFTAIEIEILRYHMENNLGRICKSKIKMYTNAYLQEYMPHRLSKIHMISNYVLH